MSDLSFCLQAAALHDEDSSALTDAIERYVHAGMPMRRAQLAAIGDVQADVRAEREQIHAAVREQHPGVLEASEKAAAAARDAEIARAQPAPEKVAPAVASRAPGPLLHGSRLPAVQDAVHRLTRNWERRPDVHVIESMDDAPPPVRHAFEQQNSHGAEGGVDGFHWQGHVYLVADALHTRADVQRVLYHESLGHFGLRGVFGKSLDPVLDATAAAMPHDLQRKAQEYGLDLADPVQRRHAAEELLAEIAQTRPELGVVQRAVAAIRTFLREHGIDSLKMSRDEIVRDFILPARGFVEHGVQPADADGVHLNRAFHGPKDLELPQFSREEEQGDVKVKPVGDRWVAYRANPRGGEEHLGYFDTESQARDAAAELEAAGRTVASRSPGNLSRWWVESPTQPIQSTSLGRLSGVDRQRAVRETLDARGASVKSAAEADGLQQIPDRAGWCFPTAAQAAAAGLGDMVIGAAHAPDGSPVWHAVVMRDGMVYDPTFGRWFAPGVYESLGFRPARTLTSEQVQKFIRGTRGLAPDAKNQGLGEVPPDHLRAADGGRPDAGESPEPPSDDLRFSRTGTTPATEGMPSTAPDSRWERSKAGLSDLIDEGLSRSGVYRIAAPMSEGSIRARAVAQNFANAERLARQQWQRIATLLETRFTPEQRRQMWEAADEQNTLLQEGKPTVGRGLERLSPEQRDVVEQMHVYGEELLRRAKEVGMFKSEGLPYWTPRMMVMIDKDGEYARPAPDPGKKQTSGGDGRNVFTSSSNLKQRKYLSAAETEAAMKAKGGELVRDIMTMPLAMQRLERAIAGRELINQIRDLGTATGEPTVMHGRPDHDGWFTLDHASFTTFVPKQVPVRLSEYFDKKLMEGLTELADNLGIRHERKGALKGGSLGLAYRDKPLVQTKFFTPDQVLTHEIGHQIDFKYHLTEQLTQRGETAKELRALADLRYEGQEDEVTDAFKAYVRKGTEKIANLVHAYVHNPERFREVAPQTFDWFDHFVRFTPELAPLKDLGPSLTIGSRDVEGKVTQWEQKPLYMRKEFEGPIKSILSNQDGALYSGLMLLKSKAMSAIMFSPLIHNLVIFGRALGYDPTMAGTVGLYFRGHAARQDNELMRTAIEGGMVPMGYNRQGMQDITDVARGFGKEGGLLDPQESWIAHGARAIIGAVNKPAGEAAKHFIDKAGDFWHGTLLWDRVADLQMGIFAHAYERLQAKGFEPGVAATMAAHWSNRYAGAVARENMGEYARKAANVLLFSRSFNMGNLGTVKDLAYGMPSGLRAKIEAEYGRAAASKAFTEARRKAWVGFVADAAMSLISLSVAQSAVDRLMKDKGWDEIFGGYTDRARRMWENIKAHPVNPTSYSPWQLSPTHDNEPGKQDRVDMGQLPDAGGRHEYMRLPTGKVVEDLFNWTTHFPTTFASKSSPLAKAVWTALSNDKGFGVPVYDPNGSVAAGALDVAKHLAKSEVPWDTIVTAWDKLHGKTSTVENDKLTGNMTGFTFSQGHPQGPEAGVAADVEARIHAQKMLAMEDVKRLLRYDKEDQAREKLEAIGLSPREVTQILKGIEQPKDGMTRNQQKRFGQHGSEQDQERMDRVTK